VRQCDLALDRKAPADLTVHDLGALSALVETAMAGL